MIKLIQLTHKIFLFLGIFCIAESALAQGSGSGHPQMVLRSYGTDPDTGDITRTRRYGNRNVTEVFTNDDWYECDELTDDEDEMVLENATDSIYRSIQESTQVYQAIANQELRNFVIGALDQMHDNIFGYGEGGQVAHMRQMLQQTAQAAEVIIDQNMMTYVDNINRQYLQNRYRAVMQNFQINLIPRQLRQGAAGQIDALVHLIESVHARQLAQLDQADQYITDILNHELEIIVANLIKIYAWNSINAILRENPGLEAPIVMLDEHPMRQVGDFNQEIRLESNLACTSFCDLFLQRLIPVRIIIRAAAAAAAA